MEINETLLPGVGVCFDFVSKAGPRVGVVTRSSGRRELVIYDQDDPDAVANSIDLSTTEALTLAGFLSDISITEIQGGLAGLIEGIAVDWVTVPSDFEARSIGDAAVRGRTRASIVAVVTDGEVDSAPGPERLIEPGDTLVVVGTPESLEAVVELLKA